MSAFPAPGEASPLGRQMRAITVVVGSIEKERERLSALRFKLTKYREFTSAKYVPIGEAYGEHPRVVVRFDGHKVDDPEGRFTEIAGTALHALITAWLDGEFKLLVEQEDALAKRNLVAEVEALLSAERAR